MTVYEKNVKEALFSALYRLLQFKGIDSISVDEILKSARLSRSTFYRTFKDKFELLQWSHERIIVMTFSVAPENLSWRDICLETLRMYLRHPMFYRNGIRSSDVNSLQASILEANRSYYRNLLSEAGFDPDDQRNREVLDVYLEGAQKKLVDWISSGMKESPESLTDIFYDSFPQRFIRCLELESTALEEFR